MLDRNARLRFKGRRTAIPIEGLGPRQVPELRSVSGPVHASDATRLPPAIGIAVTRVVTGGAGDAAVGRKALLAEQPLAQGDLLRRRRGPDRGLRWGGRPAGKLSDDWTRGS